MAGSPWTNQNIALIILTEQVTGFSGLFGYSPTVGAGNLIFSLAAVAGTDPYGNTYPQGFQEVSGSNTIEISAAGGVTGMSINQANADAPGVFGANAPGNMGIFTGRSSGATGASIDFLDSSLFGTPCVDLNGASLIIFTSSEPSTISGNCNIWYDGTSLKAKGGSGNIITLATT